MEKPSNNIARIWDIITVVVLSLLFFSPLFVADDLHDATRMGNIIFGMQWLLVLIPVGLVALWRGISPNFSYLSLLILLWFVWIFARGKTGGVWYDEKFIWFAGCFALFFIAEAILKLIKLHKRADLFYLIVAAITLIAAIEAVMGILQIYGGYRIFHGQFKVTGTFFNPAPYAIFLVASLPWALYLSTLKKDTIWGTIGYWVGYITACLILVIVPSTQSRAAYLAAFSVILIWGLFRYKPFLFIKSVLNTPLKRKMTFTVIPVVLIGAAVALFMFKKDSASGRLLIWKMAFQSAQEQVITGNGFNTLQATIAETQADYFASGHGTIQEELLAGSVPWAFNEPLQMLSETGIIGLLLMLLVFGYALFYPVKSNQRDKRLKIAAARGSIGAILVFSLFSYPFYFYPVMVLLFMAFAVLSANGVGSIKIAKLYPVVTIKTLITVACGALIVLYIDTLPKLVKGYWTWDEAEKLYQIKEYKAASESYEEVFDYMQYNGLFLQQYGKCLAMLENHLQSIEILKKSGQLYRDEFWYIVLADSYKAVGDTENAEKFYRQAAFVVPHKFYPLYLLAKLYNETDQKEKAKIQANIILDKEVKVESTAIKEIKEEMKAIVSE